MHVIRIVCLADGTPTPFDGRYVVSYEPAQDRSRHRGIWPKVDTTTKAELAQRFDDIAQALACYRQTTGLTRDDGEPDRPLTMFTVEVIRL